MQDGYQIAVYYFPNYHQDRQNEQWHGKGWTEWELVKHAKSRFPGHQQPKVPLWGYEDESKPEVMEKKIAAAADHGISAFIFDWYWYEEGPYLRAALDRGFLNADNNQRLKFALMWANHDWVDIHPAPRNQPYNVLRKGRVRPETFVQATEHVISNCFSHPSYWKVHGGLFFSLYDLSQLIESFGGVKQAAEGLEDFRSRVRAAGRGNLHLNAVIGSQIPLPWEEQVQDNTRVIEDLGVDSVTHYAWLHHQPLPKFPFTSYAEYRDRAVKDWDRFLKKYKMPYLPNVIMGWDSTPRTIQSDVYDHLGYPFLPILQNNYPSEFKKALEQVKQFLDKTKSSIFTINAWNEWTEGSYLEPDTINGFGYLEAIKDVFGTRS